MAEWWPSDDQRRLYGALLDAGQAGSAALAAACGLPVRTARTALAELARGRLVRRDGRTWVPLSPGSVLEPVLLGREERLIAEQRGLAESRGVLDALHEEWQRAQARRGPEGIVRLLHGPVEIQTAYEDNIRATRDEVLVMVRPPMLYLPVQVDEVELAVMRSGVRWRALYQTDFLDLPGAGEFTASSAAAGETGRVATRVPMKLMIHDRRTALVPLEATEPGLKNALLVSSSMLLEALVSLFEVLWERAAPLHGEPAGTGAAGPDDALLALLAAGLKDEAIARRLGCGVRTVRRRIAVAMESLDARTRFQAGYQAARDGRELGDPP
jgi:hypothetical protein